MIFGAERGLEKSVCYFAVGEGFLFSALPRCDRGNFGRRRGRLDHGVERHAGQNDREYPWDMCRPEKGAHCQATLPESADPCKARSIAIRQASRSVHAGQVWL
jgi:hypothetical protein